LPSRDEERDRYEQHNNSISDLRYVEYLNVLLKPLANYLDDEFLGLDYGAGQDSVVKKLCERGGLRMRAWDPIFSTDSQALSQDYRFVIATEVVEHFHNPAQSFTEIDGLLKPEGVFGLLTQFWPGESGFQDWFYARDRTHVCFYSRKTMEVIAEKFGWEILEIVEGELEWSDESRPVAVIFRKM